MITQRSFFDCKILFLFEGILSVISYLADTQKSRIYTDTNEASIREIGRMYTFIRQKNQNTQYNHALH